MEKSLFCAGLEGGHMTQKPVPIFARIERDFVTDAPNSAALAAAA